MGTGAGSRPGVRLTARGAMALVFAVTVIAEVIGSSALTGLAFIAACLAAVQLVHPRDLLPLAVSPPLVFFLATLVVQTVKALGAPSLVQALGLGLFTVLSSGAPWLFVGSALGLGLAWRRGLPRNVRALRDELRATRAVPGGGSFAPEPEGYFEPRVYGKPRGAKDETA